MTEPQQVSVGDTPLSELKTVTVREFVRSICAALHGRDCLDAIVDGVVLAIGAKAHISPARPLGDPYTCSHGVTPPPTSPEADEAAKKFVLPSPLTDQTVLFDIGNPHVNFVVRHGASPVGRDAVVDRIRKCAAIFADEFHSRMKEKEASTTQPAPASIAEPPAPSPVANGEKKKRPTFLETLDALHALGGSEWDKVKDPDKYIREMRGDEASGNCPQCGGRRIDGQSAWPCDKCAEEWRKENSGASPSASGQAIRSSPSQQQEGAGHGR